MSTQPLHSVTVSRAFASAPMALFDAWLDENSVGEWLFKTPDGVMRKVELDPRVGGTFCIVEHRAGGDVEHTGEFVEMRRPTYLAFTFSVPQYASEKSLITLDIQAVGSGSELTLTSTNILPEYAERTRAGWTMILDGLAKSLGE